MPHPRSMSGSAATGLQPMTQASVPPRSRSLHHQGGRPPPQSNPSQDSSRIRVNIPSPTISGGGIMPFPEIQTESTISGRHSHDQDSTDFSRAMSDLSLNNGNDSMHATTSESSFYADSISGLPRDRRSDHHLRAWDGGQEPQERLHDINRESLSWRYTRPPRHNNTCSHRFQPHASRSPRAPRCQCIDVSRLTLPLRAAYTPSTDAWRKCL